MREAGRRVFSKGIRPGSSGEGGVSAEEPFVDFVSSVESVRTFVVVKSGNDRTMAGNAPERVGVSGSDAHWPRFE